MNMYVFNALIVSIFLNQILKEIKLFFVSFVFNEELKTVICVKLLI